MKIGMPVDVTKEKYPDFSYRPVCAVLATAVLSGEKFSTVYNYFRAKKHGNWTGTLYEHEYLEGIKHFGAVTKRVKAGAWAGRALSKFVAEKSSKEPDKVYAVRTTGHIQVVKGRQCIDQGGLRDIIKFHWKRKRVTDVYELVSRQDGKDINLSDYENSAIPEKPIKKVTPSKVFFNRRASASNYIIQNLNREDRDLIITTLVDTYGYKKNSAMVYYYKVKKEMVKNG